MNINIKVNEFLMERIRKRMDSSTMVNVYIGKKSLHGIVAEHWAIKVGHLWYEIPGNKSEGKKPRNRIDVHQNDEKYVSIEFVAQVTFTGERADEKFMVKFNKKWIAEHQCNALNGDNCQLYVKDVVRELTGSDITTQNNKIGNVVVATGVGLLVASVCTIFLGFTIKGSH